MDELPQTVLDEPITLQQKCMKRLLDSETTPDCYLLEHYRKKYTISEYAHDRLQALLIKEENMKLEARRKKRKKEHGGKNRHHQHLFKKRNLSASQRATKKLRKNLKIIQDQRLQTSYFHQVQGEERRENQEFE